MKKIILIFIFSFLLVNTLYAEKGLFKDKINGEDWMLLGPIEKHFFLKGLYDGISCYESRFVVMQITGEMGQVQERPKEETESGVLKMTQVDLLSSKYQLGGVSEEQIDHLLTTFYSKTENIKIPVLEALYILKMIIKGLPQEQIDKQTKNMRRTYGGSQE